MKVAVIGAGLTGLSAAGKLKGKADTEVFEKEETVGGLCSTVEKGGYRFDYTGHFLHFNGEKIKKQVMELFKSGGLLHKERKSGIYFKGDFVPYPFQSHIHFLPEKEKRECLLGFLKTLLEEEGEDDSDFYRWMLSRFGEGITEHFMLPYNRKLWTVHPRSMTTGWMGRFVPRPKPEEVIAGALGKGKGTVGYNASYYYPQRGIGQLPERLASGAEKINFRTEVEKVFLDKKVLVAGGRQYSYDVLINTSPLKSFIRSITDSPEAVREEAALLKHTSLFNINFGWKGGLGPAVPKGTHWLYFPEEKYDFYRVGFPSNISGALAPEGCSSCYVEISCSPQKLRELSADRRAVEKTAKLLKSAGVIPVSGEIQQEVILPIEHAYVIYDNRRDSSVEKILSFLQSRSVFSAGRYGAWEYSTMEEAIEQGGRLAEKCLKK